MWYANEHTTLATWFRPRTPRAHLPAFYLPTLGKTRLRCVLRASSRQPQHTPLLPTAVPVFSLPRTGDSWGVTAQTPTPPLLGQFPRTHSFLDALPSAFTPQTHSLVLYDLAFKRDGYSLRFAPSACTSVRARIRPLRLPNPPTTYPWIPTSASTHGTALFCTSVQRHSRPALRMTWFAFDAT